MVSGVTSDNRSELTGDADLAAEILELRHELGNASMLLDAAIRLLRGRSSAENDDVAGILDDVKRRIDDLVR